MSQERKGVKAVVLCSAVAVALCGALVLLPRESQSQIGFIPGPYATFQGVVTGAYGPAPAYVGSPCTVQAEPSTGTYNCRIRVTCGGQMIYGSGNGGYNRCQIRATPGAMPTAEVHDTGFSYSDGDPRMDAYLPNGPVTVSDSIGPVTWQVTIGGLSIGY